MGQETEGAVFVWIGPFPEVLLCYPYPSSLGSFLSLLLLAILGSWLYNPDIIKIPDTLQCEDLHYYAPSNLVFAACEDSFLPRFQWFPPLAHLDGPAESTGSIHVIDPETMLSSRLTFENFHGPFITHGIDVIQDPDQPDAVYIFAVNHLANPDYHPEGDAPKARSQIEIFHNVLKTSSVRHVRSVLHPLIATPNDIYAKSPFSFYVTNDHYYRDGRMRQIEDLVPWAKWSSVVHIQLDRLSASDGTTGVNATVALTGIQNCNGFGHGQSEEELLVTSAIGGILYRAKMNEDRTLSVLDEIPVDSTVDNPSYYTDPYRSPGNDASGYVLAGLRRAIELPTTGSDPKAKEQIMVWYVRPKADGDSATGWEKRVLFEDDGTNIRAASAALLVPIEPEKGGAKEAWLFVSGFVSSSTVAVKVKL